jgi:deferrochelatase/peroxidase EfeB
VRRVPVGERGPKRTYRPDTRAPTIYGDHQPGIATPQLEYGAIGAFDLDGLDVLAEWTRLAEALMREGGVTVTIGLGATAVPPHQRPVALRDLPAFPGDALDPARCGGDACVLVCSEEPVDLLPRFGTPRWRRHGVRRDRGALGFRDGINIPRRPLDFDRHVWVTTNDRSWMLGGTYLVVRDIEVLDSWHRLSEDEQERAIGRSHRSGAPLTGRRLYDRPDLERLPSDAHIRLAAPRTNAGATMLRRGYDTREGLLFLAFQKDPRRQFVPVQQRLARHDALQPHTRHVGSAVFAIPPGARRPHGLAHALLYCQ